jgi:hypothetical protein
VAGSSWCAGGQVGGGLVGQSYNFLTTETTSIYHLKAQFPLRLTEPFILDEEGIKIQFNRRGKELGTRELMLIKCLLHAKHHLFL